ncbi:hypothetical protein ACSI5G_003163 [Vibrio vulnificus]|nr:hypothetical protein [Vibrio vulnificus]EGQ9292887.1 hypothetical protein [Vibrio vulnificus]HAS8118427.1 hypothetical protein [Vibrio vulnificus]HAS8436607.1 hypothetical protein [Vibrio vulnificus]
MTHRKPLLFATTVTLVTGVWFWHSSSQATSSVLAETEPRVAAPHAKAISVESKAPNAATPTQNTNSDPQVVFAQALEDLAPPAPTADVKELAKTPQPDVENDTLEATTYTQVITSEPANFDGSGTNSKPRINAEVARQIQSQVFGWELDQGAPIHYSLNIDQLFVDADDDFLTLTVRINVPGLKVRNLGAVQILGTVTKAAAQPQLMIAARDDHHGSDDQAWVKAYFDLPAIGETGTQFTHPLIGQTFYRLETTQTFAGVRYPYEVIYCQAWKLINHQVYFAAARNRRQCPDDEELKLIGEFEQQDEKLILTSSQSAFDAKQTWMTRQSYPSNLTEGLVNHLTTVHDGNQYETYTMLTDKAAMEARLNVETGRKLYEMVFFDYLFIDAEQNYLPAEVGNYIYERQAADPTVYQRFDSDLNIHRISGSFDCSTLLPYFELSVIAGRGDYEDVISYSHNEDGVSSVACFVFPSGPNKRSLAINHDYRDDNDLQQGEIYSYILRPKPQFAHLLEELKINLIYHHPQL